MQESVRNRLTQSLATAIDLWMESVTETQRLPYLGDETSAYMASAAIAVLQALADLQAKLIADKIVKSDVF